MTASTIQKLEENYSEFPGMCAEGVSQSEIDLAATRLGVPFSEGYQGFLRKYGGGHVGSLCVAGLRQWKFSGSNDWNVVEITEHYRKQRYPGVERWVIFSDDGFGNPIGFDKQGRVWISDHNSCEFACLESSFEDWIRRWALKIEPRRGGYIAQEKWPSRPS